MEDKLGHGTDTDEMVLHDHDRKIIELDPSANIPTEDSNYENALYSAMVTEWFYKFPPTFCSTHLLSHSRLPLWRWL